MAKEKAAKDKDPLPTETEETNAPEATQIQANEPEHAGGERQSWLTRCKHWALGHKKITIPLAAVGLLGVLAAVPFTRYALAGMFVQQTYSVRIVDADTNKPVSSATVRLAGKQTTTDNKGQAYIRTNVGNAKLEVSKKYYQTTRQDVLVPFKRPTKLSEVKLKATGRSVSVKVLNKITQIGLANAVIKAGGTEAKTDREGAAVIVVSADQKELKATLSHEGFNDSEITLQVTSDEVPANTFEITPSGKVYLLSNQSGKVDVIKTNLDGSDRKVVVAGTGKEDKDDTALLTSPDGKYLVLHSKRDGGDNSKLFLIDCSSDQMSTLDEGNASFTIVGWNGSYFVYVVNRKEKKPWDQKLQALKSYDAKAKKIILLDEVSGDGNQFQYVQDRIGQVVFMNDEVVYSRGIFADRGTKAEGREASLSTIKRDGNGGRRKLNTSVDPNAFATYNSLSIDYGIRVFKPGELYFINYRDVNKLYEYQGGDAKEVAGKRASDIDKYEYKGFIVSPGGKKTVWTDARDGKTVTFVGDMELENEKEIGRFTEYGLFGWFNDDYILLNKKGSELYILSADGKTERKEPLKVSDYKQSYYYYY